MPSVDISTIPQKSLYTVNVMEGHRRGEPRKGVNTMKDKGCCPSWKPWVILLFGALYLLRDLGVGDWTFGINWWTVAFVCWGLAGVMMQK